MYKKTVTYTDYNGTSRTKDLYFNLSKAEMLEMEMGTNGGYAEYLTQLINNQDRATIVKIFKELLLKSYGEKSLDGDQFIKSEELSTKFSQTEAYSDLYWELATNTQAAIEFANGIIPESLKNKVDTSEVVAKLDPGSTTPSNN